MSHMHDKENKWHLKDRTKYCKGHLLQSSQGIFVVELYGVAVIFCYCILLMILLCFNVAVFCYRFLLRYCPAVTLLHSAIEFYYGIVLLQHCCILPQNSATVLSCCNVAAFCHRILLRYCPAVTLLYSAIEFCYGTILL